MFLFWEGAFEAPLDRVPASKLPMVISPQWSVVDDKHHCLAKQELVLTKRFRLPVGLCKWCSRIARRTILADVEAGLGLAPAKRPINFSVFGVCPRKIIITQPGSMAILTVWTKDVVCSMLSRGPFILEY